MFSNRFNRRILAALAVTALAMLAAPGSLSAQTPDHPAGTAAQFPTKSDLKSLTTSGSYLAARHASVERDASSAAAFYRSALRSDPKNNELLDRAFISSLADGDIDEAVKPADRTLTPDKADRVARPVVGVRDLKLEKCPTAQININESIRGPLTDAVATLRAAGLTVLATAGDGEVGLYDAPVDGRTAWLFGNEAHGLPDDLAALADHRVSIPIHGRAESLNLSTAAALCLYESARRGPSSS